jgi:hypothetical protein
MYFGTLVTQARREQEQDTWQRDMDASRAATPNRWRTFWMALGRFFSRRYQPSA